MPVVQKGRVHSHGTQSAAHILLGVVYMLPPNIVCEIRIDHDVPDLIFPKTLAVLLSVPVNIPSKGTFRHHRRWG